MIVIPSVESHPNPTLMSSFFCASLLQLASHTCLFLTGKSTKNNIHRTSEIMGDDAADNEGFVLYLLNCGCEKMTNDGSKQQSGQERY